MVNHVAQPDNGQLTSLLLLPIASSAVATLVAVAAVAAGIAASRFLFSNPSPDCSESLKAQLMSISIITDVFHDDTMRPMMIMH